MPYIRCTTAEEVYRVLELAGVPVIQSDLSLEFGSSYRHGLRAHCSISINSGSPTIRIYGTSSLYAHAFGTCTPTIQAFDASTPELVSWDTAAPRIETFGSSKPKIRAWDSSAPIISVCDSSTPDIEAYDSSTPTVFSCGSGKAVISSYNLSKVTEGWGDLLSKTTPKTPLSSSLDVLLSEDLF